MQAMRNPGATLHRPRACWRGIAALGAAIALGGCEAPLNLEGVEARSAEPIRRSDLFQRAADNGNALLVVGRHGLVLRSSDQGASWARQELQGWPSLIDVAACPDGQFATLASESQVWVSGDDGANWTAYPIDTEEAPQGIACDPDNRIWVVGSFSTIMVSEDGGASWDDRSIGEDVILTTIQFLDAERGLVFGEFGTSIATSDGGETWEMRDPLPNDFYPQDALFIDRDRGWAAGLAGQVLHTADGGASWQLQKTPSLAPIYALASRDGEVYAVGGEGVLLGYRDGRWQRLDHGLDLHLQLSVLQPVGADRLLIGGAAGELHVVTPKPGAGPPALSAGEAPASAGQEPT